MPEQYSLQEPPKVEPLNQPEKGNKNRYFIAAGVIIGFACIFALGLVLGRSRPNIAQTAAPPSPTPTPKSARNITPFPSDFQEIPLINFLPNKKYFDDTYAVITKEKPYQTLILSVSRIEQQHNFTQYIKVNYFDGKVWDRKSTTSITNSSNVATNTLLRSWISPLTLSNNSSSILASLTLPQTDISFKSSRLINEISVQSVPESTKFIYQGTGMVTINDEIQPAYIFYSRTYSYNASDLNYLTKPDQTLSNWLLFWDKGGSFYYLDDHIVPSASDEVSQFKIGIALNQNTVLRTTQESVDISSSNSVTTYSATFNFSRDTKIFIPLTNSINKSDKRTYSWITSSGEGTIATPEGKKIDGVGIVEYIRQNKSIR